METPPLLQKDDFVRLYVPDLEAWLAFYRDRLGCDLIWRTESAAGLEFPEQCLALKKLPWPLARAA